MGGGNGRGSGESAGSSRGNPGVGFLSVDKALPVPAYRQLYGQVVEGIRRGAFAPGAKLPSIRLLSRELGISHTTVEQAYLQLSVEGFVRNVPRSGYVVEGLDAAMLAEARPESVAGVERAEASRDRDAFFAENEAGGGARWDFSYANLPDGSFPVRDWRRAESDVLYADDVPGLTRYVYASQPCPLSRELSSYLARTRGVSCIPEQVVLQAGTDGAIATALQLFDRGKHVVGVEEPGFATVREVAERMGFAIEPIPVLKGPRAYLEAVRRITPKVLFCTPSHQFPTGRVLQVEQRLELLKLAGEANMYVIEDDSCNEYRYDVSPVPSLQSLDAHNRVIYLGNFSKTLSPSMRCAYLVLPPKLLGRYYRLFNYAHPPVPWLVEEALARLIADGAYERHVRRMVKGMNQRHDILLDSLRESFGSAVSISGAQAGMHLYVVVHNGMGQRELLGRALSAGAAVYGTNRMWVSPPEPNGGVMVGFSSIPAQDIPEGVAALARAWLAG